MGPVIAQREIDRGLLAVLAPFRSGFGWDAYLLPLLGDLFPDFRPGLYLGARMRHARPLRTDPQRRFTYQRYWQCRHLEAAWEEQQRHGAV
jgi:hypothetical protein